MQPTDESSGRVPEGVVASPAVLAMFELYGPAYVWFAVCTSLLGAFATLLTGTIINVAIPEVMGAFGIGQDQAQWLSTGFLAAGAITMLLTAWSLTAFGMRNVYVFSMLIFLAGSVIGGTAMSPEVLIFSRVVQGAASGLLGSMAMVITYQIFPVNRRGLAMGIFGVGQVLAPALGPALGGFLIDSYSWRYVFFLAVPFAIISIPLALLFMPKREVGGTVPPFDWPGIILSSLCLVSFLEALSNGQREGWQSEYIVGLFAIAFFCLVIFLWWQFHAKHPMLDLKVFTYKQFSAAAVVSVVVGVGLYGSTFLIPLFLQTLQGISPTESGLLMVPAGLAMAAIFPIGGALSDRIQPRIVIAAGLILFAISSWLMRYVDVNTPYLQMVHWAIIGRVGLALIFPSLNAASLTALPLSLLSQGSGIVSFLRQLGGAFGVNALSIYLTQRTAEHAQAITATQVSAPATLELLQNLQDMIFGQRLGYLLQSDMTYGYLAGTIYQVSLSLAFREGFIIIAIIMLVSLIPTWFLKLDRD
jgi:DHA2 family multidrug resistance protein